MTITTNYILTVALALYSLFFLLGGILPPTLVWFSYPVGADWLYDIFSASCQQQPSRTFWYLGYPMALCARCIGVYLGFSATALVSLGLKKYFVSKPVIIVALFMGLLEKVMEWYFWPANNPVRFVSGLFLGFFLFLVAHNLILFLGRKVKHYGSVFKILTGI